MDTENDQKRLKIGVIGLGLGKIHVAAYSKHDVVGRLVVCDTDSGRRAEALSRFDGVAEAYDDLQAMLAAEDLDAVSVTTPDHMHRPHAEKCLQAGCHVLLTKPIATNLKDARAIVLAAEESGQKLMVAHERRFRTFGLRLKEILDSGELGDTIHIRYDSIQDKRRQFERAPWYASTEAGRTAITGSGIHQVDFLRFLVGEPVISVGAFSNARGTLVFPGNKTTSAIFRFESGIVGQVTATYEAHWPSEGGAIDDAFRLVGTKGVVIGNRIARDGFPGWEEIEREEDPIPVASHRCIESFLSSIVEDRPVEVSSQDAFASLAAAVAADESARTGRFVVPAAGSPAAGSPAAGF
jgi:predicted dehydrogenase